MAKKKTDRVNLRFLLAVGLTILLLNGIVIFSLSRNSGRHSGQRTPTGALPYFPSAAAAQPLPRTLEPVQFSNTSVAAAYEAAKEIPEVLAQQPCSCHCDRMGHRSLLDCFRTEHASYCDICMKEALFALREYRNGKSPKQIRAAIDEGAYQSIQLHSYCLSGCFSRTLSVVIQSFGGLGRSEAARICR